MVEGLDMTLDDIIKKNKETERRRSYPGREPNAGAGGRGRGGRAHGSGPIRRFRDRGVNRAMPYRRPPPPPPPPPLRYQMRGVSRGTKLYVSNLAYDITNEDIRILFSDIGHLRQYGIHYDGKGRPMGSAEVVFERYSAALEAISRYNNNRLFDGRPIHIELMPSATPMPPPSYGIAIDQRRAHRREDGSSRERGGGHGIKRGREKVSAEALDADLEKYRQRDDGDFES